MGRHSEAAGRAAHLLHREGRVKYLQPRSMSGAAVFPRRRGERFVRFHRRCRIFNEAATVASQTFVLTNSTSLAPPQAAGLVRSVARPLQIANASLVCNLVPSVLPEKVGKKRRLDADRIVPQATEGARRRRLRPAHENLSAKLYYSAACVETTLPSIAVSTQGDGKTRCCGNNRPSTNLPQVSV